MIFHHTPWCIIPCVVKKGCQFLIAHASDAVCICHFVPLDSYDKISLRWCSWLRLKEADLAMVNRTAMRWSSVAHYRLKPMNDSCGTVKQKNAQKRGVSTKQSSRGWRREVTEGSPSPSPFYQFLSLRSIIGFSVNTIIGSLSSLFLFLFVPLLVIRHCVLIHEQHPNETAKEHSTDYYQCSHSLTLLKIAT